MSHRPTRRAFLGAGAATLAACAVDPSSGDDGGGGPPGSGRPWAEAVGNEVPTLLPEGQRPDGVLELFLLGGVSAWESFCVVPSLTEPGSGEHAGTQWWLFQEGPESVPERFDACAPGEELLGEFGLDAAGREAFLGPWALPLRRADLAARMRVLVCRHEQFPHQGGLPLALTGHRFGSPRMTGTAAHVQRFFGERQPRDAPYAHVLLPRNRHAELNNATAAAAVGLHRAGARPLVTWIGDRQPLVEQLRRGGLRAGTEAHDRLLALRAQAMEARLQDGRGRVRAPAFDDYDAARRVLAGHEALEELFDEDALLVGAGESCGESYQDDVTAPNIATAVRLLTHPTAPARYVCAVDGGLEEATGCLGYDTHYRHVVESSRNLLHVLDQLASRINLPGEGDPEKLDLDRHLVVITTEFGRTPWRQGEDGTDHWPRAYAQVLLGGFVGPEQAGVVGSYDADGVARDATTPSELRAALLLALGIWPYVPEGFAVGDSVLADTEIGTARLLRERVLGHPA